VVYNIYELRPLFIGMILEEEIKRIKQIINEEVSIQSAPVYVKEWNNYQNFGEDGENAYEKIMDRNDGPLDEFVVIMRAMTLVCDGGSNKVEIYANALQDALNTLRKHGGELDSLEVRGN